MHWHIWVVLIAESTGSALRVVRPPNLHITPGDRRDPVHAASATGSLNHSSLATMAQAILASLLARSASSRDLADFAATNHYLRVASISFRRTTGHVLLSIFTLGNPC